jgi:hypothetical protein
MRVELADDVYVQSNTDPRAVAAVLKLLEAFDSGRHDWIVDALGMDAVEEFLPRHVPTLAATYTSLARGAAVASRAWTGTSQAATTVRITPEDLDDYAADLSRSAVVIVEDLESDGNHFLPTLAHVFGAERIRVALDKGWLEVRHSGGTGRIPAVAAAEAARFRRLIRVVAFLDSDRLFPGEETLSMQSAAKAKAVPIEVHVLAFREAENYAPDKVLRQVGNKREAELKVAALRKLPAQHRRHVDMKKGLARWPIPQQRNAFGAVDPGVVRDLRGGFGSTVLKTMFEMRLDLSEHDFVEMDADAAHDLRTLLALIDSRI